MSIGSYKHLPHCVRDLIIQMGFLEATPCRNEEQAASTTLVNHVYFSRNRNEGE